MSKASTTGALLLLALAGVGATGCALATPYKGFEGPDLPDEQVAIVDWESEVDHVAIDENLVREYGKAPFLRPARLLPGTHRVLWARYAKRLRTRISRAATIDMQPGHVYLLKTSQCSSCMPVRATMWIEDVTTGSVVAGDPRQHSFLCADCSSYAVPGYSASAVNTTALKQAGGLNIAVGTFSAPDSLMEIGCRGAGMIRTADERPFADYVRTALIDELRLADLYTESGAVTLTGTLDKIDFGSMRGTWFLNLAVKSSNGRSVTVAEDYDYETSLEAKKACALSAQAFGPAVQALISKLVHLPEFSALLR